jgi:hypothetical protein
LKKFQSAGNGDAAGNDIPGHAIVQEGEFSDESNVSHVILVVEVLKEG